MRESFSKTHVKSKPLILPFAFALLVTSLLSRGDEPRIDFEKAHRIYDRSKRGEPITDEERAYMQRAIQAQKQSKGEEEKSPQSSAPLWSGHLTPLTELGTAKYKGEDGGLYGGGKNEPPKVHLEAALKESAKIQPLDADGKPAKDGKIVLLSIGMSNTTMEYSEFKKIAEADPRKSPHVVVVDGAKGARTGMAWALDGVDMLPPEEEPRLLKLMESTGRKVTKGFGDTWSGVETKLKADGVTPQQVQVLWIKQAEAMPAKLGDYPAHARTLQANLTDILNIAKRRYPNLRVAYLSSRIYGGYATTPLNPEPYAYEEAFAMRWLIQAQIQGEPRLNFDPARGAVQAPPVLWGPYLWADGTTPRKADGLVWKPEDFVSTDHTHPSPDGRQKVARLLLNFFKADEAASRWFVKPGEKAPPGDRLNPSRTEP